MQYRRNDEPTPVGLDSKALRQVFGWNYKAFLTTLIDQGIAQEYTNPYAYTKGGVRYECKGTFSTKSGSSKKYVLSVSPKTPLVEYVVKDREVIKRINKARAEQLDRLLKNDATARRVFDSLKRVNINTLEAIRYTKQTHNYSAFIKATREFLSVPGNNAKRLKAFIQDMLNCKDKREREAIRKRYKTELNYEYAKGYAKLHARIRSIRILDEIQNGTYSLIWMSKDRYSGRIFHPLTSTPRDIRQFLSLDGKPLVEFDGANCQWKLLVDLCDILLDPVFFNERIEKYGITKGNKAQAQENHPSAPPLNMSHKFKTGLKVERERLIADLDKGRLRQAVMKAHENQAKPCNEQQAKQRLISHVLFANPDKQAYEDWLTVRVFKGEFPAIFNLINRLKKELLDESLYGYKPFDIKGRPLKWKAFPRLLQRMESEIFIKGMADIDAPIITMHDAIFTNEAGEIQVKKALDKAIRQNKSSLTLNRKTQ
jgi:hypothetical protein